MSAPVADVRVSAAALAAALGRFPPTAEQTAVIEAPLGPALVVAGAGSGKTETMAARVVWLVANGLVRRDEVLGLTFTRKAAGELAGRIGDRLARLGELERLGLVPHLDPLHAGGRLAALRGLDGPDVERRALLAGLATAVGAEPVAGDADDALLHRPTVTTYNSFADGVVREHAVRIGRDPEASVLTESAAWLLMRRVVFASDDVRLELREEAVRTLVDGALRLARDAVDNLADLDEVAALGEAFREVALRPSENPRFPRLQPVEEAAEKVGGLAMLVDLAREYAARKRRLGVLDYSDQVAGALEAVRAHPSVAAELRDRYRVVLLDEYQDTSVVQTDLLAALFTESPVMAVGDPHQAIYGWRGASAGNLGGFAAAFSPSGAAARYSLRVSWRNGVRVLDAANAVLDPLAARSSVPVDALLARPGAPVGDVAAAFDTDVDAEADRVAAWFADVRARRDAEVRTTTGAVLFRSKKHMVRFGEALGARGIPHRILGLGGLLATPEVVDVVAALRVVADPSAGSALLRLLAGPRWAIGLADLRRLAELARRLARHDTALQPLDPELAARVRASAGEDQPSLVDALEFVTRSSPDHGWLAAFTPAARERLAEAGGVFAGLRRAVGVPIPDLVRLIELELRLDVELAAHETRGPARIASAQLRAFVDELQGFLAADDSGSLTSLLAWLDRAELLDEFQPRTEPPEDDVVQLLTIHGAKGLEWDAVAVVRMVEGELPSRTQDAKGWLRFGVLPFVFRGDASWLPTLRWDAESAPTQQAVRRALDGFAEANKARLLDEERRLAYVAITRARDHLLLTGSAWSGTKRPRAAGPFLVEAAAALGTPLPETDDVADPYTGGRRTLSWPLDALGARRGRVVAAAALVDEAVAAPRAAADDELALLLAERAAREAPPAASAPVRIPASRWKEFVADYAGAAARQVRPLPERPHRRTRLGTLFHAWVEHRSGRIGTGPSLDDALWEQHDDEVSGVDAADAVELARLQRSFEASEWADLQPLEVETEIDMVSTDLDGRAHLVICKLDAVYRRGDRIEIVDWKTGAPPTTIAEREERMLQVDLYRRAYHARHGVPIEGIDVALVYVGSDVVVRG